MCRALAGASATALALVAAHPFAAHAQSISEAETPSIDENGVNLLNQQMFYHDKFNNISAGPTLVYRHFSTANYYTDISHELWNILLYDNNNSIKIYNGAGGTFTNNVEQKFFIYTGTFNKFSSKDGDMSLVFRQGVDEYLYVTSSGDKITFKQYRPNATQVALGGPWHVSKIEKPDGEVISINHRSAGPGYGDTLDISGIQTITSNKGYMLQFEYASDDPSGSYNDFRRVTSVNAYNLTTDQCNAGAYHCPVIPGRPRLTFTLAGAGVNITNAQGQTSRFYTAADGKTKIALPQDFANGTETMSFSTVNGKVNSVTRNGKTWTYSWGTGTNSQTGGATIIGSVTDPTGRVRQYTITSTLNGSTYPFEGRRLQSIVDESGGTTTYAYDSSWRLSRITYPEGNYVQLTRDANGNITERRRVSKTPGTPPDLVETFAFPSSCANLVVCHKPINTIDSLGNQTDYTYDATHGGVLTVTKPAATASGVRPQQRYTYSALQAYYLNGGSVTASGQNIYRLTGTSTCLTGASCAGTSDELKTTIGYGPQTAGVANNLLPVTNTVASGDGAISLTTTTAYDATGHPVSVDGPLAGNSDATYARYDAAGRLVGSIGPDPDGSSSLPRVAQRYTYDANGYPNRVDVGTVADESDTAWSGFSSDHYQQTQNDSLGRPVRTVTSAASGDYAERDTLYDAAGRVNCTIDRMVPSSSGTLPTSCALVQTTSSMGPDRITQLSYDAANRLTTKQSGVGTPNVITETTAYTANGKAAYVVDANSNRTTYEYDGHDRLVTTRFPQTTLGSNASSATDYEQLTYGDNVNATSIRLRDGNTIGLTYDNLGRVTSRTPSGENTVNFSYNLLDMPTAIQRPADGVAVVNTYDALGRRTYEGQAYGSAAYQYDAVGNLSRLTWGDGFYVNYDYDSAGRITAIRENGATSGIGVLALYNYDNLGRRSGVAYGNGTSRSYAYDPVGRLAGLKIDLAGTTNDLIIGGIGGVGSAVAYNPMSQIVSLPRSNDAYAYTARYNLGRTYTANGLNQYSAAGPFVFGYDNRGNLNSSVSTSGSSAFGYNKLNQLISAPGVTLGYDVLGRLLEYNAGVTTRFGYAGTNLISEIDTSFAVLRRYVPGPGTDEPVVWYEGAGTASRRWLQADERGSVVAVSDAGGNALAINRYDEYGIPQSGNLGRFQYTGQTWLAEAGLYNYKARMYSPSLGRFMQTDPIGYRDGMNWYNYTGSDPVNRTDPTGRCGAGDSSWPYPCPSEIVVYAPRPVQSQISVSPGIGSVNTNLGNIAQAPRIRVNLPPLQTATAARQQDSGTGCNQGFLNFFNGLRDLGEATDQAGDKTLVVAGGVAIAGAVAGSTVVGAPAGLTAEAAAGGLAVTGLLTKAVGGGLKLVGDVGAAVETGTLEGTSGTLIARGTIQVIPFADDFVGAIAGQAAESFLPQANIPRTCR